MGIFVLASLALLTSPTVASPGNKTSDFNLGRGGAMVYQIPGNCDALKKLGVNWFYNWSLEDKDKCQTEAIKFIPSVWGLVGSTPKLPNYVDKTTPVITYNEPNYKGQAEMTPQQAIEMWPYLEALGNPLTSPPVSACESPNDSNCLNNHWLEDFMSLANLNHRRVDIIALHFYGCDSTSLLNYLDLWARQFPGKPIWLTEWACLPWAGDPARYIDQVLPGIERRTKANAWFAVTTEGTEFYPNFSELVTPQGNLTSLGLRYRQYKYKTFIPLVIRP